MYRQVICVAGKLTIRCIYLSSSHFLTFPLMKIFVLSNSWEEKKCFIARIAFYKKNVKKK